MSKECWGCSLLFSLGEVNAYDASHCVYNSTGKIIAEGSRSECVDFISYEREKHIEKELILYVLRHAIGHYFLKQDVKPEVYFAIDGGVCYGYGGIYGDGIPLFPVLEVRVVQKRMQEEEEIVRIFKKELESLIKKFH